MGRPGRKKKEGDKSRGTGKMVRFLIGESGEARVCVASKERRRESSSSGSSGGSSWTSQSFILYYYFNPFKKTDKKKRRKVDKERPRR